MVDTAGENQPVTITLERWRWDQVLLCLDRYVIWLRGNFEDMDDLWDDVEWANQLDAMTDNLREIVVTGGNTSSNVGETT